MNVVNKPVETVENQPTGHDHRAYALRPPLQLSIGCIVTLRMRGHTRTNGQEYFAPAVVLQQYDDPVGSIEALVWDYTAGTHYQASYPIRELSSRGIGPDQELYESQSNIGAVLFSPDQFAAMAQEINVLSAELLQKHRMMRDLIARVYHLEKIQIDLEAAAKYVSKDPGVSVGLQATPTTPATPATPEKPRPVATTSDTKNAKRSE